MVKDILRHREDFPVLAQEMNGKRLAFLDSAASAQKPLAVLQKMKSVQEERYSNIHRGLYSFSQVNTEEFEAVRKTIAGFINAPSEQEIVFTKNATEAINLVAHSWAGAYLQPGDEIILTEMEHHANIVPWQLIAYKYQINVHVIRLKDDGTLDLDQFQKLLSPQTKLVACVHVSNALGTINDVKKITEIARDFYPDMKVLIDGSQAVVHTKVDVQDIGCDFYVFTGHKLYGPTGVGVLWGKYNILNAMPPYQGGGDMIERVTFTETTFKLPPARFEAGTPAIVEVIGLGEAIKYVEDIGVDNIAAHEENLYHYAMEKLKALEGLTFYGPKENRAPLISFTADWGHPSDIGMILDQCGVAVRTGHHCCYPVMDRYEIDATIRASLGLYSNKEDIDQLVEGLQKAREMLN